MSNDSTKPAVPQSEAETAVHLLDDRFDPIEAALRDQVRSFIQSMIEAELGAVLARPRYGRRPKPAPDNADGPERITGHRHGHRSRSLMGPFGLCGGCGIQPPQVKSRGSGRDIHSVPHSHSRPSWGTTSA